MHARRWQLIVSSTITLGIIVFAFLNRAHILEALSLTRNARPMWLVLAMALGLFSFYIASLVYRRVLHSLGYHLSALRLWGTALVAILLSQSVPAGGVASYAFLMQSFRRQGIPSGHSALLASLEALSYVMAMLLMFAFSVCYIAVQSGFGATEEASIVAAVVGAAVVGSAGFVLTRDQELITRWLLRLKNGLAWLLRQKWSDEPVLKIVDELARGRALIAARRRDLIWLVLTQLTALTGHSLVMLLVLKSLGVNTSLFVVMAAFGVALVSSTFNVLPGGGGTVETAVVIALQSLGVGNEAIAGAIIFRLLNFWLLAPIGLICYRWLMHGKTNATSLIMKPELVETSAQSEESKVV
jgi:uncharacterized protein (TIRG00374 family)